MSFARHNLFPLTAALLAALAVLFVSTASLARGPVDQGVTSMSMTGNSNPCEHETGKATCQKACLVFCQSLVPQADVSVPARLYSPARYALFDTRRAGFTLEADDPPPRISSHP